MSGNAEAARSKSISELFENKSAILTSLCWHETTEVDQSLVARCRLTGLPSRLQFDQKWVRCLDAGVDEVRVGVGMTGGGGGGSGGTGN